MTENRTRTAQVAVEALIASLDGYEPSTVQAVLAEAQEAAVPQLYVDMLREQLCDTCQKRARGHGHFARYCLDCSLLPYGVMAP